MSDTDARIEGFLLDAFSDHGNNSSVVSENTRRRLAELEDMFRRPEVDERKKDAAALRCRKRDRHAERRDRLDVFVDSIALADGDIGEARRVYR